MRPALLGVLALCLSASSAQAARVVIDFDFSQSQISVLGGVIQIPPDGSISPATSARMSFQASGTGGLVAPGPVELFDLDLDATIFQTLGQVLTVSGMVGARQIGNGNAMLTGGLTNAVFQGNLLLSLDVFVDCSPTSPCDLIGTFPISLMGPQTLSNLGTLPIANINDIGNAMVQATLTVTLGGLTAVVELVGSEVGRSVVPEPNTAGLVGLGVLALAGLGRRRLRR